MNELFAAIFIILALAFAYWLDRQRKRRPMKGDLIIGNPLNDFEKALDCCKHRKITRSDFIAVFLSSEIYLLGEADGLEDGNHILKRETKIKLAGWRDGPRTMIPAFGAKERLQQAGLQDSRYICMSGGKWVDVIRPGTTVVLYHRFDCEMCLALEELVSVKQGLANVAEHKC